MTTYLLEIFTTCNNRGATLVTYESRKFLSHKAFRDSLTLAAL